MTARQVAILNSLVTFAAENIRLSEEEREVAKIVGQWALLGGRKTHDYKTVNSTLNGGTFAEVCNYWAEMGWRVVGVISDTRSGYAHSIVLERPIGVTHPDD